MGFLVRSQKMSSLKNHKFYFGFIKAWSWGCEICKFLTFFENKVFVGLIWPGARKWAWWPGKFLV